MPAASVLLLWFQVAKLFILHKASARLLNASVGLLSANVGMMALKSITTLRRMSPWHWVRNTTTISSRGDMKK
jgi:hypothetical protein